MLDWPWQSRPGHAGELRTLAKRAEVARRLRRMWAWKGRAELKQSYFTPAVYLKQHTKHAASELLLKPFVGCKPLGC